MEVKSIIEGRGRAGESETSLATHCGQRALFMESKARAGGLMLAGKRITRSMG